MSREVSARGHLWVFGYGSLMWDGWEAGHQCLCRVPADLRGYARTFNKLSVRNWGSPQSPGPTLNLIASNSVCRGIAFEFCAERRDEIVAYLTQREGKNFTLTVLPVTPDGGTTVDALVPLYNGPNTISPSPTSRIAEMALAATGVSGACSAYVKAMANHLHALQINDQAVNELCAALDDLNIRRQA